MALHRSSARPRGALLAAGRRARRRRTWAAVGAFLVLAGTLAPALARWVGALSQSGAEILVNETTAGTQATTPHGGADPVATAGDGSFVAAWDSDQAGGSVLFRRFTAAGTPLGAETVVNGAAGASGAAVAQAETGQFVVAWERVVDAATTLIEARVYGSDGIPLTGVLAVASGTVGDPAVSMDADGDWVIAWSGSGPGDTDGVAARRGDLSGLVGSAVQVNVTTTGGQSMPSTAMADDGSFVVAWQGNGTGDADGVFGRRFDVGRCDDL